MADTRGVFGLRILYKKKTLDQWVPLPEVWISPSPSEFGPNTGYFGGGIVSSPTTIRSTIDKIFYASDTRAPVPGATLSSARYLLAATGSSTAGYFGGGNPALSFPGDLSTMDKITYSTDLTTTLPSTGSLSVARDRLAATGNSDAGYFGGGGFPAPRSTMDKITYSTDLRSALPSTGSLSSARRYLSATGSSTAGYFGGGFPDALSTVDKITYSTDLISTLPATGSLSAGRYSLAATGNSTAGYFGGSQPGSRSTVDKITYSDDTRTTLPSTGSLSVGRSQLAATGNSRSGYFGGGGFSQRSTMDKIIYSTDSTFQVPGASLSTPRNQFAASSARANAIPFSNPAPASPATRFIDGAGPSPGAQPPAATPTPQTYNGSPVNV